MKRALITGITGQDGSYLAELLLAKGYEVHGIVRRSSSFNTERLDHIYQDPHVAGLPAAPASTAISTTAASLNRACRERAARRDLQPRRAEPRARQLRRARVHGVDGRRSGTLRLLEAIRELGLDSARFYQASSSEMFGARRAAAERGTRRSSRAARTRAPRCTPTSSARTTARRTACSSRAASSSTTSSPRRGETFVTRKITRAAARIKHGLEKKLFLGNLDAKRDWGFAGDYVEAMWLMLQQDKPDDYVDRDRRDAHACASSSTSRSARSASTGRSTSRSIRATSARPRSTTCAATPSKAREKLGWKPKVTFKELIEMMVQADEEDVRGALRGRAPSA